MEALKRSGSTYLSLGICLVTMVIFRVFGPLLDEQGIPSVLVAVLLLALCLSILLVLRARRKNAM